MYATNDYVTGLLVADHQRELRAEAAENRLGKLATAGRPSWWRRLTRRQLTRPNAPLAAGLRLHHSH